MKPTPPETLTPADAERKAREEGWRAGSKALPASRCPYLPDTKPAVWWLEEHAAGYAEIMNASRDHRLAHAGEGRKRRPKWMRGYRENARPHRPKEPKRNW